MEDLTDNNIEDRPLFTREHYITLCNKSLGVMAVLAMALTIINGPADLKFVPPEKLHQQDNEGK